MSSKNRYIILVIGIVTFGLFCVGGTYAFLSYAAEITNANYSGTFTCFDIDYDQGDAINGVLFQSSTPKGGLSGTVTMNVDASCDVTGSGTITLNVDSSTGSLLLSEGALKYAVYEDVNSSPVASGTITATGNKDLYTGFTITNTAKTYYIYVWLDGAIADNDYVDIPFSGYIHASATQNE